MRILGLDLGVRTGFAVIEVVDGEPVHKASGVWELEGVGTAERMIRLEGLLREYHAMQPFDFLAAEAPNIMPGQSMESRRMAFGLSAQVELLSVEWHLQLKLVSTQSLKSAAARLLGEKLERKGKTQSLRAVTKLLGSPPADDNEADAVLVALWAAEQAEENA